MVKKSRRKRRFLFTTCRATISSLPLLGLGVPPAASSRCISSTAFLAPPLEWNKKPSEASSKQARLGTMVSQLRKLRFPLMIRTTYGKRDKGGGNTQVSWETHKFTLTAHWNVQKPTWHVSILLMKWKQWRHGTCYAFILLFFLCLSTWPPWASLALAFGGIPQVDYVH